ncbi:hypothetical protein FZEAL_2011 [Fusarium zealandicum]|uniref:Uncharacterized protein n=1 Tax=Fusarium zealandicum TaxID=1053134 RepID=A0A8H4URJ7_9HYPO|nr:hypothetical protein FZEAL_2011 [Fusarium zealandicum]
MSNWEDIPPPPEDTFTIEDIRRGNKPHVNVVVRTGLIGFFLEYYQVEGEGRSHQHFFVRLNEAVRFKDHDGEMAAIKGCAIWMEPSAVPGAEAELKMRFVIGTRAFFVPLASFRFPMNNATLEYPHHDTIIDLINILQGSDSSLPWSHRTNLLRFRFCDGPEGPEGARDVLTQWMIRLNMMSVVDWQYSDQVILEANFIGARDAVDEATFDSVIGTELAGDGYEDPDGSFMVDVTLSQVRRGNFSSPRVRRVTSHQGMILPYQVL